MNDLALQYSDEHGYQETAAEFSRVATQHRRKEPEDSTGADIITPNNLLLKISGERKYPLWNVLFDNVPLSVSVHYDGGYWFAELDWLNVSSHGESPSAAIDSLEAHIDHFINFYSAQDEEDLTDFASALKQRFSQIQLVG